MSDPTWIEFKDLDAEVFDKDVIFANENVGVNSLSLNDKIDLKLAVALARDTARNNNILDDKDCYWAEREKTYDNLLNRLNTEIIPY